MSRIFLIFQNLDFFHSRESLPYCALRLKFNKLLNLGIDEKYKSRIDLLPSIIDFNVPSSNKIFNYIKMLTQNQSIK